MQECRNNHTQCWGNVVAAVHTLDAENIFNVLKIKIVSIITL